jgi:MoaA/NifB/PqqE/SkfB family radical SAM enzyme
MVSLNSIGFYTLTDARAANASASSKLSRCELLLTGRCNFKCPYCRRVGGKDLPFDEAATTVRLWASQGLGAIRFSGGEPMLYPRLRELVGLAKASGIEKIAISTNGSLPFDRYQEMIDAGVNDFSISLDACCAEDGDKMAGGVKGAFYKVIANIAALSKLVYVTVGVVLTDDNADNIADIVNFAQSLGVSDIRVIPAAQVSNKLVKFNISEETKNRFPILKYRIGNIQSGRPIRGLSIGDSTRCGLVLDDMAASDGMHYPCIIYLREGGAPIGKIGPNMRQERDDWFITHNTHQDPICSHNCLDVCVDYNNQFAATRCGFCHCILSADGMCPVSPDGITGR